MAPDLKSVQCGFDSHRGHLIVFVRINFAGVIMVMTGRKKELLKEEKERKIAFYDDFPLFESRKQTKGLWFWIDHGMPELYREIMKDIEGRIGMPFDDVYSYLCKKYSGETERYFLELQLKWWKIFVDDEGILRTKEYWKKGHSWREIPRNVPHEKNVFQYKGHLFFFRAIPKFTRLQEGWAYKEKVSHHFYDPLLDDRVGWDHEENFLYTKTYLCSFRYSDRNCFDKWGYVLFPVPYDYYCYKIERIGK